MAITLGAHGEEYDSLFSSRQQYVMKNKKLTKTNGGGGNFIAYHQRKGAATKRVVAFLIAKGGVKLFDSMTRDQI